MKALVAWRILAHEKGRSGLAITGIFVAILLMFLQLAVHSDHAPAATIRYAHGHGYTDGYLGGVVVTLAIMMSTISYVPAATILVVLYLMVWRATQLPMEMTAARSIALRTRGGMSRARNSLTKYRDPGRSDLHAGDGHWLHRWNDDLIRETLVHAGKS